MRTHDFVVGGWILARGSSSRIAALLLREIMDGGSTLRWEGDTGFDAKTRRDIGDALEIRAGSPFKETVPEAGASFCEPGLRVPVEFVDFDETGLLRNPVFSRLPLF